MLDPAVSELTLNDDDSDDLFDEEYTGACVRACARVLMCTIADTPIGVCEIGLCARTLIVGCAGDRPLTAVGKRAMRLPPFASKNSRAPPTHTRREPRPRKEAPV